MMRQRHNDDARSGFLLARSLAVTHARALERTLHGVANNNKKAVH